MKRSKLLTYMGKGLAALALAGTLFTSPCCVNSYKPKAVEQGVVKDDTGNLAVLVIDMQEEFLEEVAYEEKMREIPYQLEVLDYCGKNSIPVFILEYEGHGRTIRSLKDKVDSLEKKVYITKKYDNGFIDTDLAEKLRKNDTKTTLLMGIYASACVLQTGQGAIDAGFKIMTSKDLIADTEPIQGYIYKPEELSNESIEWYKANGTYIDSYKDVLELISKKEYSKIDYFIRTSEPFKS